MGKSKVIVLRSAGTNCDKETVIAFQSAGADIVDLIHINQFIQKKKNLNDYNILAIPGGFSYGDDISAGRVFANELKFKLWDQVEKFISSCKLIIGICNGFQILVKTGLIPDATLALNDSGKFECRWIYLKVENNIKSMAGEIWTKNMPDEITLPVAHGEGKFVPASQKILNKIEKNNQVLFRYTLSHCHCEQPQEAKQSQVMPYPYNPNGAIANIAGVTNKQGNILGMMPHPERHLFKYHHPNWTKHKTDFISNKAVGNNNMKRGNLKNIFGDGFQIFSNAVSYAKKHL